jgi:site-specific recombinase XerD
MTRPRTADDDHALIASHSRDQRRRGLEESTIDCRARMLAHLSQWLAGPSVLDASSADIEAFLDSRKIGRKARYAYISNLHTFYAWTNHAGLRADDPTVSIIRPRQRQGIPRPISDTDLAFALQMARGEVGAMVALAAFEGMRCIEIARLVREDVLDERTPAVIVAHGKGDKPRAIPLHAKVAEALRWYRMPRTGPVFHWPNGKPLPAWKVSQLGNDYLHGIGLDATMHQLRHWFGTTLYRTSGRDLLLVRDLMGHSSITTTTVYAAYDRAGAAEAVEALAVR